VAGSTGAAIAAIVMIFEMTLDYNVIIPMTLTVAIAYGVRRVLSPESIYTMKLVRRGHTMPDALQVNLPQRRPAGSFMDTHLAIVAPGLPVGELQERAAGRPGVGWYLVADGEEVKGVISAAALRDGLGAGAAAGTAGDLASRAFVFASHSQGLYDLASIVHAARAEVALVVDAPGVRAASRVRGVVSWEQIASSLSQIAEMFAGR
jgi:CIC family chloride channel protein